MGFAAAGTPNTWLMPFLFRATPRLDLAGWSLRSEVNLDGDRAFWRHTRPDPQRHGTPQHLALQSPSGDGTTDDIGILHHARCKIVTDSTAGTRGSPADP